MRDMTAKELHAALARRGWRKVLLWIEIGGGRSVGLVAINGKFNRRASLAHAIREASAVFREASAVYRLTVDEGGREHSSHFREYAEALREFRAAESREGVDTAYLDKVTPRAPLVRMCRFEPKKAHRGA